MTIKELAEELQVSKVTVSKRIEALGLKDRLQKEGNKYIIPETVADRVRLSFNADVPEDRPETKGEPAGDPDRDMIIDLLRAEIEEKNKQIAELHLILQQQNHLLLAAQAPAEEQPIEAERPIEAQDQEQRPPKKGFWSRFFGS